MWAPDDLADVQADFLEFLEASEQTCDIRRPAESQDTLGSTSRTFPTVVANNVPCVLIHDRGELTFDDLADKNTLRAVSEILLPLTVDVNLGDQIITETQTYSVRRLDEANTHSLVKHVWVIIHGRTA